MNNDITKTERNIHRVRHMVGFDMNIQDVRDQFADMTDAEIFLAWHAAKILNTKHPLEESE